jgi:hypothetical protein
MRTKQTGLGGDFVGNLLWSCPFARRVPMDKSGIFAAARRILTLLSQSD